MRMQPWHYWKNDLKKNLGGSERNSNPRPLRYRCNALPTELSKPHEAIVCWFGPIRSVEVILGSSIWIPWVRIPFRAQKKIFQVIFPVVLWLHSHLPFFHDLIATVGHLLPWNSYTWAEYYVHWTYRAEPTHDRSHVALIAQFVEHCIGNAKVVGSNPVQNLRFLACTKTRNNATKPPKPPKRAKRNHRNE